jgi:cell division protease FtsH
VVDRNYERAERMLRENMDKLQIMADTLMKYETIDRFQIDAIMNGQMPGPPADWEEKPPTSGTSVASDDTGARPRDVGPIGKTADLH